MLNGTGRSAVLGVLVLLVVGSYAEFYPTDGKCGGVIEGNNRTLFYDQIFEHPVQCVWTIQAVGKFALMKFQYEEGTISLTEDSLSVTVFTENPNLAASSLTPYTRVINTTEVYEYGKAVAFAVIVFRTNSTGHKYFRLDIQAGPRSDGYAYMYEKNHPYFNFHSSDDSGNLRYPKNNPDTRTYLENELSTFVISNEQYGSTDNILLQIDEVDVVFDHGGFEFGWIQCIGDGVLIFELLPQITPRWPGCSWECDPWEELDLFKLLDRGVCGVGGGYGYYAHQGFLIALSSDSMEVSSGFSFNWKNVDKLPQPTPAPEPIESIPGAYTLCGGVLESESGYIEYKLNEDYNSNEFCVWTIRASTYRRIVITKEESGLILGEDLITVTAYRIPWDGVAGEFISEELQLNVNYAGEEQFNLYGTLAVIVFTSNGENQGRGFRLKYEAFKDHNASPRIFTDVGSYGDTGTVSHGGGEEFFFSSFVVAPNTAQAFDHVKLSVVNFDVWAGDGCSLNSFFLHEILPASSNTSMSGKIVQTEELCHTLEEGESFTAKRGFFGLLVTIRSIYADPIVGYKFNHTIVN